MRTLALLLAALLLIFAFGAEASPAQVLAPAGTKNQQNKPPTGRCNCRCDLSHHDKFCAVNAKNEKQTFQNNCQLDCYNCTSDTDFRRRYSGDCKK